jgi:hypothetical protein
MPTVFIRKIAISNTAAATKGEDIGNNPATPKATPAKPPTLTDESPKMLEKRGKKAAMLKPSNAATAKVTTMIAAYIALNRERK